MRHHSRFPAFRGFQRIFSYMIPIDHGVPKEWMKAFLNPYTTHVVLDDMIPRTWPQLLHFIPVLE